MGSLFSAQLHAHKPMLCNSIIVLLAKGSAVIRRVNAVAPVPVAMQSNAIHPARLHRQHALYWRPENA